MNALDMLTARNREFAAQRFAVDLPIMPALRTIVIGCVDPRVDPADVFGLHTGEAAILRNIGGRVTNDMIDALELLRALAQMLGSPPNIALNIVVLHHTDCGITRLAHAPDLLAPYLGVEVTDMETHAVGDPWKSVALDVAALRANPRIPSAWIISGLVYDVATGLVETVVSPEAH